MQTESQKVRPSHAWVIRDDPYADFSGCKLKFRLTYQGLILSENSKGRLQNARASHKHSIRKHFHKQLSRLWEINNVLRSADEGRPSNGVRFAQPAYRNSINGLCERFSFFGYRFVPLITHDLDVLCSVDVLFLRHADPGSVFSKGDIDNRLKTLFDALTMPKDKLQLGEFVNPDEGEDPFFCLLEDDSLITRAVVETDTLLSPVSNSNDSNDARVIITVETSVTNVRGDNIGFV